MPIGAPMPTSEVWDVVRLPFPHPKSKIRQRRPALVVARHAPDEKRPLLWVLMITSVENRPRPGDVSIGDSAAAGLPAPSVIRTAKIATVDAADAEPVGRLGRRERTGVRRELRARFEQLGLQT